MSNGETNWKQLFQLVIGVIIDRMPEQSWKDWFEHTWAVREEELYPSLFGELGTGIYPLTADLFTATFPNDPVDPRWLHDGVFECPPTPARRSWLYVSSGLSNPWDADHSTTQAVSGLGCEFVLQSVDRSQWAVRLVQRIVAFQIMLSVGRFPGKELLQVWDRIPLRAAIDGGSSVLTSLLLAPASEFAGIKRLPSGDFELIELIGITDDEVGYAKRNGGDKLFELLLARGAAPVTKPKRVSVLAH